MVIKKYYLLAVMMMAGNMLVVNEVRASVEEENKIKVKSKNQETIGFNDTDDKSPNSKPMEKNGQMNDKISKSRYIVNLINLIGGGIVTFANSKFNWWKNKEGLYLFKWCAGWNSKPFAKGHLQICPNINFARGILWILPGGVIIKRELDENLKNTKRETNKTHFWFHHLLKGFISVPLVINFSTFSFSIAIDSLVWMFIDIWIFYREKKEKKILINTIDNEEPEKNN